MENMCAPLVIIQYSCDPPPYENHTKDTIFDTRLKVDAQGLKNAKMFWKYLKSKPLGKRKTTRNLTRILNEDFTILRGDKHDKIETTQQFYEYYKISTQQISEISNSVQAIIKKTRTSVNPKNIIKALKTGNILYLPVHGGHALDEHSEDDCTYILPDNVYVISFNPPNSDILMLNKEASEELVKFIVNVDALNVVSKSDKRKKLFEQEFFKQLRIWGSGDTVINRGLITDRTQDLMIRPSKHNGFQYLKKTWLRKTSGVDIASLYTQLACLYANESKIIITK